MIRYELRCTLVKYEPSKDHPKGERPCFQHLITVTATYDPQEYLPSDHSPIPAMFLFLFENARELIAREVQKSDDQATDR